MYISCHSFPIKGTPLGEIDTLLVMRLPGWYILSLSLLLYCYYVHLCC